jgi:hypothetical protein
MHMNDLWLGHISIEAWTAPNRWAGYFEQVQQILDSPLTHLDVNDPIRREVGSLAEAADFVCAFGAREDSRWVFGRFKALGIDFSVRHFRELGRWPNSVVWHMPLSFVEKAQDHQRLEALFDLGNQALRPFYGYSDERAQIAAKKKPSGAMDFQTELPGIFWLTYFNAAYVAFFGKGNFTNIPGVEHGDDGSVTIVLGHSPKSVANQLREHAATMLGRRSFVDSRDIVSKPPGRFALTFQQLLAKH